MYSDTILIHLFTMLESLLLHNKVRKKVNQPFSHFSASMTLTLTLDQIIWHTVVYYS